MTRDVLVSGASVAGQMLAYWLREHGFRPVVVERTPAIRAGLGGHAVDLFGPAVDVAAWTGILDDVLAVRTETRVLALEQPGRRTIRVDAEKLAEGFADRSVEVLRGHLTGSCTSARPASSTASATASPRSRRTPPAST